MNAGARTPRLDSALLRLESASGAKDWTADKSAESESQSRPGVTGMNPPAMGELSLRPALEVDHFAPSRIVRSYVRERQRELTKCLEQLGQMVRNRPRVVGFASAEAGEGCTTVVLALASVLGGNGQRVLVIDCAPDASLASSLGMLVEKGWQDAVLARRPLREVIIRSQQDRYDVLPSRPAEELAGTMRPVLRLTTDSAGTYDWVLVDFGEFFAADSQEEPAFPRLASAGEASEESRLPPMPIQCRELVVVQRSDRVGSLIPSVQRWAVILGVIETFTPQIAQENAMVCEREAA